MAEVRAKTGKVGRAIMVPSDGKFDLQEYPANYRKYEHLDRYSDDEMHDDAKKILENSREKLELAQEKLWACKKYGVLIILQGMDTAGKDGTIRHVMSGVNPQGCRVECFKTPTATEHAHDYLWRYAKVAPERGEIVIFNRSHYEDVLACRVHPEYMEKLPDEVSVDADKDFWRDRYQDILAWERHLARNGIVVLKFFLHISRGEQRRRLLDRLTHEEKYWKVSPADIRERGFWDDYEKAFEEALSRTSRDYAPWFVVPANDKKVARAVVADIITKAIESLDIDFPTVSAEQIEKLREAKAALEKNDGQAE